MEMYNADGSRGAMCGNGIRCLGKYVYDKGLTRKVCLTIDTDAGPRGLELLVRGGAVDQVTVDMGQAKIGAERELEAAGRHWKAVPVSVGNPHAVIFCPEPDAEPLEVLGPLLERHPDLPERSNVELVQAQGSERLKVRVWERGSGMTLACGTGACAAFAAARRNGLCGNHAVVQLPGGELDVLWTERGLKMTGPARTVFEGEV